MIYPVIPQDKRVIVQVRAQRCLVARYRLVGAQTFEVQPAANWEALEANARAAVEERFGAITDDDQFPCPNDLAARATWPDN